MISPAFGAAAAAFAVWRIVNRRKAAGLRFSHDHALFTTGRPRSNAGAWTVVLVAVAACLCPHQLPAEDQKILKGHQSLISCATFSPDSKRLASCAADDTVMIWDVSTGKSIRTLKGHKYMVWSVAYSPDGKQIVSASWDKSIRIWDAETGALLRDISVKSGKLMGIAFAPDGKTFATVKRLGGVQIRDASTGKVVRSFVQQAAMFPTVAFDPEGKRLFATMDLTSYWMWILEPKEDEPERLFFGDQNRLSGSMAISPDGKLLATPTHGGAIEIHDLETGGTRCKLTRHTEAIQSLAFSRDGKRLASGSEDKSVRIWNIADQKVEQVFTDHTDRVWSVAYSPDGRWLASASEDMTVRLRPLPTNVAEK